VGLWAWRVLGNREVPHGSQKKGAGG
jgi:hypothetical protein